MSKKIRKLFSLTDVFLILFFVIVAVASSFFAFSGVNGKKAVIKVNNKTVLSLYLDENCEKTVSTEYGTNIISVQDGYCFVKSADCRDSICVNSGKINNVGDSIVCLPHRLIIEVEK